MSTITIDPPTQPASVPADPFQQRLAAVSAQLGELVEVPVWSLTDEAVQARLGQVLAVQSAVGELVARLVGSVAERDLARLAGASSDRAWLMGAHRMSPGAAARLLAQANAMTAHTGVTRSAWAGGVISGEQAELIGATIGSLGTDVPDSTLGLLQVDLIHQAQLLNHAQFQVVCRHAVEVVDPDAADAKLSEQLEAQERRALVLARLRFGRVGDGTSRFSGRLPDQVADMFKPPWKRSPHHAGPPPTHPVPPPAGSVRCSMSTVTTPTPRSGC